MFFLATKSRTQGNKLTPQQSRFRSAFKGNVLPIKAVRQQNNAPREVVGSPSPEASKKKTSWRGTGQG